MSGLGLGSLGGVREIEQPLGDRPGFAGGDLRAHVGAFGGGSEVELDEGGPGVSVQRVRPGLQDRPDDRLGPVRQPRNWYEVGTSTSGP